MRIALNSARETLAIKADPEEHSSVADIQRRLKQSGVRFRTIDGSTGVWEIDSSQIMLLHGALAVFSPSWSKECSDRMSRLNKSNMIVAEGADQDIRPLSSLKHSESLGYELFEEQATAAAYMASPNVDQFALFWAMGTGKTGAMIAGATELLEQGVIGGVLIVAERPISMEDPWKSSLEAWLPTTHKYTGNIGMAKSGRRNRMHTYDADPTWLIVHYGQLATDLEWIKVWTNRKPGVERPLVIFDESDYIKNPKSKRSRAAKSLRDHFGRCWIASGTPAPNSPTDYQHQLSVSSGYPVDLGLTGEPAHDATVVAESLKNDFYYLQQQNPRKMPETVYDVPVELNPTQRRAYEQISSDLISELEHMDDDTFYRQRQQFLRRRSALLRVCCDPQHESIEEYGVPESPDFNDPAKFKVIDRLLDEILSDDDEKVIIWTRYRNVAELLHERYRTQWGAALFIGNQGDHRELSKKSCRVLIATLQKGSSSISLTQARNAIYESLDDMSRDFAQSMARINRSGQQKDCRHWVLCATDTIEEDVLSTIRRKLMTSQEVLDDIGMPGRGELIEQLRRHYKEAETN